MPEWSAKGGPIAGTSEEGFNKSIALAHRNTESSASETPPF
jgi:hypothetical protein